MGIKGKFKSNCCSKPNENEMNTEIKYEILESLPTNGPMYISVTENNENYFSAGFPVRFYKNDKTNWVANFKPGWTNFSSIYEIQNQNLLIIAGGTLYIMNPENEKPIKVIGVGFEKGIMTKNREIVLQDQTDLTIIEQNGEYWTTERISWDGIKELEINGNQINGLSYNPMHDKNEWIKFTLDIETKKLVGGSYNKYEINPIKKIWRKIWQ